jgi:hypothetical protein
MRLSWTTRRPSEPDVIRDLTTGAAGYGTGDTTPARTRDAS